MIRPSALVLALFAAASPAFAQAPIPPTGAPTPPPAAPAAPPASAPPVAPEGGELVIGDPNPQLPPELRQADMVTLNFVEQDLYTLLDFFARTTRRNFVIADKKDLEGKKVTVISHHPIPADLAWQAFISALEASGYTTYDNGGNWFRVVKLSEAGSSPIAVGIGKGVPYTENFVTQIITLDNVSASEVSKVIDPMKSAEGKIVAYQPTNTMIITDTGSNIRKMIRVMEQLDVASPRATLEIIPLKYATASDIKQIIEALYGTAESTSSSSSTATPTSSRSTRSSRRNPTPTPAAPSGGDGAVTAGDESKFIAKVIDDERTNSIIVLANPEGLQAVHELIAEIDKDVDPLNRAQIHVVYLEHAKAQDVATVLSELSQSGGGSSSSQRGQRNQRGGATPANPRKPEAPAAGGAAGGEEAESGAIAAFDSGMRIAPDESTNSLVIIANQEDFAVVEQVIKSLDVERKQVYVDVLIVELSSEDTLDLGIAGHLPVGTGENSVGLMGASLGTSSALGLTQDMLSGLALGVFGDSIPFTMADGTILNVPTFGVVLNAIKSNSSTNIISNPALMALDNEEAKIVVGRKVPFPTTSGLNNLGQPVVSYQREDVAITLEMTPRVNSSNFVTLEVKIEAQEIEEDDSGLDTTQSGPVTSKREIETVALCEDNQTVVIGGLIGSTDTDVETKVPVLGDLPVVGALFRGTRTNTRKTDMMVFLTPHIIDEPEDMLEVQRVKEAQRQEFLRRFYGKSRDEYMAEMNDLLRYSMNVVDDPSVYRGPDVVVHDLDLEGNGISDETRKAIGEQLEQVTPAETPAGGQ